MISTVVAILSQEGKRSRGLPKVSGGQLFAVIDAESGEVAKARKMKDLRRVLALAAVTSLGLPATCPAKPGNRYWYLKLKFQTKFLAVFR